jgi:hypothetical protein
VLQKCSKSATKVTKVLQKCYKSVTKVFIAAQRKMIGLVG